MQKVRSFETKREKEPRMRQYKDTGNGTNIYMYCDIPHNHNDQATPVSFFPRCYTKAASPVGYTMSSAHEK